MSSKKQKYRRLQVDNIALRTVFEIVALILAVIISCSVVIRSYEKVYAVSAVGDAEHNAHQLAYSVSGAVDAEAIGTENAERREYVIKQYNNMLENSFIGEDVQYSGAIYAVGEQSITLFASSSAFGEIVNPDADSDNAEIINEALKRAAAGEKNSIAIGSGCVAFYPVTDEETGKVIAISAGAVDYRQSMEFDSPVKQRIVLISVVSGLLILAYFTISGIRSEKKKLNGEAV